MPSLLRTEEITIQKKIKNLEIRFKDISKYYINLNWKPIVSSLKLKYIDLQKRFSMQIEVSKPVQDFEIEVYDPLKDENKKVRISDFRDKWLILFFYPADFTFVCPTELKELGDRYEEIKSLGAEVIVISTDTVYAHKIWLETEELVKGVKYLLGADHNGKISRMFGIYNEENGMSERGAFVIDPDGVLRSIEIVEEKVGRSAKELIRKLKAHIFVRQTAGTACPASWENGMKVLRPSIKIAGKVHRYLEK